MRRILLRVAYDGTGYVGWQKQNNGIAVEEILNRALSELTGETVEVIGASRTDSGVHALGNVAVFDTASPIPPEKFCFAVNAHLPADIVVRESLEVPADFHPRYTECEKTYEYRIYNATHRNPLNSRYTYFYHGALDIAAMREAAEYLVGEHDFASFCSVGAQVKTTVRTVYSVEIEEKDLTVTIRIRGNGFLYNMVRIIAGTLVNFGAHMYPPEHMKDIVDAKDRAAAGPTAPPQGLTLMKIDYKEIR